MVRDFESLVKDSYARGNAVAQPANSGRSLNASFGRSASGDQGLVGNSADPWQHIVAELYNTLPELRFAAEYVAAAISQARLIVTDLDGTPVSNSNVQAQFDKVCSELKGPDDASLCATLRVMAVNFFLFGEVWITANPQKPDYLLTLPRNFVRKQTSPVAKTEVRIDDGKWVEISQAATCVRLMRKNPLNPYEATSHVRAAIKVATTLNLVLALIQASTRTAIHNGVILLPDEIDLKKTLVDDLYDLFESPIDLACAPDTLPPLVFSADSRYLDHIKHMVIERPLDESLPELATFLRRWFAEGMDVPTEVIFDSSRDRTNHWSQYLTTKEFQLSHARPFLKQLCSLVTAKLLIPALRKAEIPNPEQFMVTWDDFALFEPINKLQHITELMALGVKFEPELIARYLGIDPDDIEDISQLGPRGGIIDDNPTDSDQKIEEQ